MKSFFAWLLPVILVLAAGASIAWRLLPDEDTVPEANLLRMEVINACGTPRVGRAVADELQMRGFDVYAVRASRERSPLTTVVDLRDATGSNSEKMARALSVQRRWRKLPLGPKSVPATKVELDSSSYLEVRLIVGADYRRFFAGVVPLY